jgi:hypothetical protein
VKIYKDTNSLENVYTLFGNVAYVEHWFGRMQSAGYNYNPLRKCDEAATRLRHIKSLKGQPAWFRRAHKLEYKPFNRLDLNKKFEDSCLITCGKTYSPINFTSYRQIEMAARKNKKKDWQIEIIHAFESFVYQRQGRNKWVLIEIGKGFA